MDKILFKLKVCKDNFQIYRVLFDRLVNNGFPSDVAESMLREQYPEPVKLSKTEVHYGWPTRIDTASQMVKDYKDTIDQQASAADSGFR